MKSFASKLINCRESARDCVKYLTFILVEINIHLVAVSYIIHSRNKINKKKYANREGCMTKLLTNFRMY